MIKKILTTGILICGIVAAVFLTSGPVLSTFDDLQSLENSSRYASNTRAGFQSQPYILLVGRGSTPAVRDHRSGTQNGGTYVYGPGHGGIQQTPVSKGQGEGGVWVAPSGNNVLQGVERPKYTRGPNGEIIIIRDHR
jgi:hypothetical protein